jgi:hypothetical protein
MGAGRAWRVGVGSVLASALVLVGREAAASPDLVLDGQTVSLSGVQHYRYVRLEHGARIEVPAFDGQPGTTTGRLEIWATDILIDGTSEIDATGAGYRGKVDANGEGLAGGTGALVSTDAAGGGGHAGKGGDGVMIAGCTTIQGAEGGAALTGSLTDVTFGSAGSAAGTADGDSGGRGGNGGGAIVLRAGRIEMSGKLIADGQPGSVTADDSAGGGAGGGVLIQASYFLSFGGQISVAGASGGRSSDDEGGAGGGGRILFLVPAIPGDLHLTVQGGSAQCAAAAGGAGVAKLVTVSGCVDLDQDGHASSACGGADCDDSDPDVHPNGAEVCNGEDDDCSGVVDDHGAEASCSGQACVAGACLGGDAGPDADADAGVDGSDDAGASLDSASPDVVAEDGMGDEPDAWPREAGSQASDGETASAPPIELRGGCAQAAGRPGGGDAWWVVLAGAFGYRGRRSRVGRGGRSAVSTLIRG